MGAGSVMLEGLGLRLIKGGGVKVDRDMGNAIDDEVDRLDKGEYGTGG